MSLATIDKLAWVLVKKRAVLYVRTHGKELFYNPGGKREEGETDQEALIREIQEELDVDLLPESIGYLDTFSAQADGKPEGTLVEIKCYTADYEGEITPTNEIEEVAWFTSKDMHRTSLTGRLILTHLKNSGLVE